MLRTNLSKTKNYSGHSRINVATATHALLKFIDSVNQATFLEMHQVIKYVLDTRSLELNLNQKGVRNSPKTLFASAIVNMQEIQLQGEVKVSVLYVLGLPLPWQSKAQRSMTLSSPGAEWKHSQRL